MTTILISLAIIVLPVAIELYFTAPRDPSLNDCVADGK